MLVVRLPTPTPLEDPLGGNHGQFFWREGETDLQ